ncbi:zinc finger protein 585B-like [Oncorhynchus clarkii lewisi]|uniref:zinc finger protein 585B-like n=1 Tax=Oncorhynchus clarkii lewisi TaxID=490388 RepID=UPI0039B83760
MSSEKEALMDEIEKSLWNLTEDNLRYLCERCGLDGSEIKGMNHRLLRRKVMEEMWDNTESMKSEEQGMSWLVQLKEDIRRTQEEGSSALMSPSQSEDVDRDEEHNKGDRDWLPSNGLTAEPSHPSQCDDDDAVDCDEEWNEEGGAGLLSNTPDQSKLKRHIRSHTVKQHTVNPSVKPHHCSDCGKQFIVKSSLKHHRLVFHTDHPHRCGQCKKSFITAGRLESHTKTRHPPSDPLKNPHVCSKCGRAFAVAASLKRHLRTHTGEKPYVCPQCGKDYSDCGNLRKHMRRTHPVEEMVVERFATQRSIPTGNVEEMQDNTDSIKSEEQGTSWSLQLKEDLKGIQENGSAVPMSPGQSDDDGADDDDDDDDDDAADCNVKDRDWLPSNGLKAEPMSPSQSDDAVDWDEEDRDWMASDGLEVELSPERHTPEQRVREDKPPPPPFALPESPVAVPGASPGSALMCGLKRVSVRLVDCRKTPGQSGHIIHKTTQTGEKPHSWSNAEQHKTLSGDRPGSHICDHCGKNFTTATNLKTHLPCLSGEKPHVCSECGKSFTQAGCLKRHLRTHTGEKPYVCPHCGKACTDSGNLKRHIRKTHPGEEVIVKRLAYQKSVRNAKEYKQAHSGDGSHICDHCGKNFTTARSLKLHIQSLQRRRENLTAEKAHVCSECGKGFHQAGSLKRHLRTHTGEKPYVCHHCGKACSDSGNLQKHIKSHMGKQHTVKPYLCSDCGKQFIGKQSLGHHREVFHTDHPHRCGQCKKSFITAARLESHIKTRHPPSDPLKNPHVCSECGRGFPVAASLKRHLRIHTGEKPYSCPQCGNSYNDRGNLKKHIGTHTEEKPYHCSVCGMKFRHTKTLQRHHQENHKGETLGPIHRHQDPLPCPHCGEEFSTKALLKDHLRTHSSRVHCSRCDKTFSTKSNLLVHQRIHTGERPYLCPQCGKSFSLAGSLKLHLRIHAGEKPYCCTYCDKRFTSKSHCNLHLRIHTGEKPYQCPDCGRCFADGNVLKNHRRTHTGEKPFQCRLCDKAFAQLSSLKKHQETHRQTQPVSVPRLPNPYPPHNQHVPYPYPSQIQW